MITFRIALDTLNDILLPCDNVLIWTFDHGGGLVDDATTTDEEYLVGWGDNIRDDELANWLNEIEGTVTRGHITYLFGQMF